MDMIDTILATCKTNEEVSELLMLLAIQLNRSLKGNADGAQ